MKDRPSPRAWLAVFRTMLRLIFFRVSQAELRQLTWRHLLVGLLSTGLMGAGRYWDKPGLGLVPHLGIGSVVYVFVLAFILWLIIWPLRPRYWSYFRIVTFVTLVSPLAIIYAIPLEKFCDRDTAQVIDSRFVMIVVAWRIALLFFFLRRLAELEWLAILSATLLPLSLFGIGLTFLHLDKIVSDVMRRIEWSPIDTSYALLMILSWLAMLLFNPLVICYLFMIAARFWTFKD